MNEPQPTNQPGTCRVCGCTDMDCHQCAEKTGIPCFWIDDEETLCSACATPEQLDAYMREVQSMGLELIVDEDDELVAQGQPDPANSIPVKMNGEASLIPVNFKGDLYEVYDNPAWPDRAADFVFIAEVKAGSRPNITHAVGNVPIGCLDSVREDMAENVEDDLFDQGFGEYMLRLTGWDIGPRGVTGDYDVIAYREIQP